MNQPQVIVGAGYSGLIAAFSFPGVPVVESRPEPRELHRAVLRFRTDRIAALTGVDFRAVRVRKAVWAGGSERRPSIALANAYSRKVLGRVENDRSVWNLDPVERFIAPPDFYAQMVERLADRITWDSTFDYKLHSAEWRQGRARPAISTAPLPAVLADLGIPTPEPLTAAPIKVERYILPDWDVFQTVYFPESTLNLYRASITSDTLILEARGAIGYAERLAAAAAFGLADIPDPETAETTEQRYGKIAHVADERARRATLGALTREHGIYSLGRFACWRNVLLDDLPHDCAVIRRMISGGEYEQRLVQTMA